ncbi:MAG: response regulator [Candidatus Omnitrophota bacterium]|jgi:CheY-like chemotaxis protein
MDIQGKVKVLVVDDDSAIRTFLTRLLNFEGLDARSANDGYDALELAQKERFDLIFLDIRMPGMNGFEAFGRLKKINPDLSCVFMTAYAMEESLVDKTKQPGTICLRKPFEDIRQIKDIVNKALQDSRFAPKAPNGIRDRRAYTRLDVGLEVNYKISRNPAIEASGLFSSKNIAPGGIRIIVTEDIAPGAILDLELKARGSAACKINVQAGVVWSRELGDKPGHYEIGLEFAKIDYEKLATLLIISGDITPLPMI